MLEGNRFREHGELLLHRTPHFRGQVLHVSHELLRGRLKDGHSLLESVEESVLIAFSCFFHSLIVIDRLTVIVILREQPVAGLLHLGYTLLQVVRGDRLDQSQFLHVVTGVGRGEFGSALADE